MFTGGQRSEPVPYSGMKNPQTIVQALLERAVSEGRERGVQVAAYYQGACVVDAWAGIADPATGRRVDGETLFPVFSTTKGILTTAIHRLVERKAFGYTTRIAEIWPAFAANGKGAITIGQALAHASAIPHMPADVGLADLVTWETMSAAVARLQPLWPPGSRACYHAVTFGWILGEVARRVTGRSVTRLLHDECGAPIGVRDLHCGLPASEDGRIAVLDEPGWKPGPPSAEMPPTVPEWMMPLAGWMNTVEGRRACVPASSGMMSARALARHYAALVPGGVDGVELLSPARVRLATEPCFIGDPPGVRVGLGYMLGGAGGSMGSRLTCFGHGGYGGSQAFADPEPRLAFAFTRNLYVPNSVLDEAVGAIRGALEIPA